MRLLFIIDPLAALNPKKDSTLALIRAALRRGDSVYAAQQSGLELVNNAVQVRAYPLTMQADALQAAGEEARVAAATFDTVLMRKEPPVDEDFITATRLLEHVARTVPVVNHPQALRDMNEKLVILNFPDLIPPTWAGSDFAAADDFCRQAFAAGVAGIVLKPLNGMGGQGVYVSKSGEDMNFRSVFDLLSAGGCRAVMLQHYLPAVRAGDCRVFTVNDEVLPWMLVRIPRADDHRSNMAAGGTPQAQPLSAAAKAIAQQVAPVLAAAGIRFAGLDIIADRLIEINITCPTGLCEVSQQSDTDYTTVALEAMTAH